MIRFTFDWSTPLNWAIAAGLALLLIGQVWLLVRRPSTTRSRQLIRLGLNVILWLALVAYTLQPVWYNPTPTTHALLVGDDISTNRARVVQDSLGIKKRFTTRNFTGSYATITLLGQAFPAALLSRLSGADLRWVPDNQSDKLTAWHGQAVVRQGELQRITGRIKSSTTQWLKLRYAGQTLDSVKLATGEQNFTLQTPVFTRGRTAFELSLSPSVGAGLVLDTIRCWGQAPEPMAYQFILDNPDFETKTLANWLGRLAQSVQLTTQVSTNIQNSLSINATKNRVADVLITDPGNAANLVVKRAIQAGKRVLFINLTNPEADIRVINQALGSRFSIRKVANAESVPVGKALTALPYEFNPLPGQQLVAGYPVAVQRTAGLVGVSLLNETFPLALSGDSLTYARLWYTLLAPLQTPGRNNVLLEAPLFSGLRSTVGVNNAVANTALLRIGTDTARLNPSPINPLSADGLYRFSRVGWVPVADSLAVFVEAISGHSVGENRLVSAYVRAHKTSALQTHTVTLPTETALPEWVWLVVLMACFTALWIEPKLG